jgi:D-tyrosyl-tRNA(Tyr) deacylase
MRILIQRVTHASVTVDGKTVASIGHGLVILLGIGARDIEEQARFLAEKVAQLRIFEDDESKFNLSLLDVKGEAIVVSQFTLYGDTRKGRRPSFTGAMPPEAAEAMYRRFVQLLEGSGLNLATGVFGAKMEVEIVNDGPVTFILEDELS